MTGDVDAVPSVRRRWCSIWRGWRRVPGDAGVVRAREAACGDSRRTEVGSAPAARTPSRYGTLCHLARHWVPTNSLSCHLRCTHEQADRPQGGRRVAPWALAPRPGRAPSFRRDGGTLDGAVRRCRTARMGGRPQPKSPREVNPNQRRRGGPRALALGPGWAPLFFRRDGGSLNGAVRRCRTARMGGRRRPKSRVTGPERRARRGRRRGGPLGAGFRGQVGPPFFRRDGGTPDGEARRSRAARMGGPQPKPRATGPERRARTGAAPRRPPRRWLWGPAGPLLPAATAGRPTARPGGAEPPA